ncbi:sulfate transporter family protein [Taklimakanibacter lacteus]|uniref:sulfate transporter family protein n=1 Tax=Taklimakanibacter lacteus TaxID=2268456 RepID=UPI000E66675F
MIKAAFTALGDVLSPDFRSVLIKAIGLAIALLIAVIAGTVFLLNLLKLAPWGWGNSVIEVVAGLGMTVLAFFMIPPVTALFAGLYLDHIAGLVERKHYPADAPGRELPMAKAILLGLQFGLLVLIVNLAVLPMLFFGIGAIVLLLVNAYLLSREYFEMAAMRHMPVEEARLLRKENSPRILAAGLIPAALALIPIVNLTVPLFSTSYFVHIFKALKRSSA